MKKKKYLILKDGKKIITEEDPFIFLRLKRVNLNLNSKLKEMEILEQEISSGKGFFSILPNGKIISSLIQEFITNHLENDFEASQIKTPFIYKIKGDESLTKLFEERVYLLKSEDEIKMILKPNADLGLFHLASNIMINKKCLPLRIYENSTCLRYLLSGEINGIKKARGFFLFDCHSFCENEESAIQEYFSVLNKQKSMHSIFSKKIIIWFKLPEKFLNKYQKIIELYASAKDLIIVEILSEKKSYWEIKSFTMDEDGDRLFHVQFDLLNPIEYGIKYLDGEKTKPCIIIHNSLGTVERWIFFFIKNALKKETPVLPLWLSPTQVRILPIKDTNILDTIKLAEKIRSFKIRVDVDDRSDTLGAKIRNAEKEWIPYIIVFGDKEASDQSVLPIRKRGYGQISLSAESLIEKIKEEVEDMPYRSLPNWLLSKRPIFYG
ncbi:MAG: His/Gly/Thr/Pro-type tRNA ligase C-terminal domain-containing protein [Patescibacteria group bacterium]|jgi:threonyl-tRNA synthetase